MLTASSGSNPTSAFITSEQSATLRANGPTWSCVTDNGTMPRMLASPWVAFNPATPQKAAGSRIDAAVSVPSAAAHSRAETAAAEPPDDPRVCSRDSMDFAPVRSS